MVYLLHYILYFILYNVVVHSLVELPQVEDNNISITETIIRKTVNNLFASFKLKNVHQKLKEFATIHNYFVTITMKDCDILREIARLAQVNNIDNNTQDFITKVNEVFDEADILNMITDDTYLTEYIDTFIGRLKYFNAIHRFNGDLNIISPSILQHLYNMANSSINVTKNTVKALSSQEYELDSSDSWKPDSRRIFQGHSVHIKKFPFMASIQFFERFQCSGSIIKSDLVITSASCLQLAWNNRFYRENPLFLSVRVGSDFAQRGGELIPVLEINFHPLYDPKTLHHNLAITRLSRHIFFHSKKVKKIAIDREPQPLSESDTGHITIVGYGARDKLNMIDRRAFSKLAYAKLDYYPYDECKDLFKKHYVTRRHFCGGFFSEGGGACNFDAGGPGIIEGTLMGVISFGSVSCGAPDSPTVFTKLGFYADWIDEIMDQNVPHTYRLKDTLTKVPKLRRTTTRKRTPLTIQPLGHKATPINMDINDVDFGRLLDDGVYFKDFIRTIFKLGGAVLAENSKETNTTSTTKIHTTKFKSSTTQTKNRNNIKFTAAFGLGPAEDLEFTTRFKKKHEHKNNYVTVSYPSWKDSIARDNLNYISKKYKHRNKLSVTRHKKARPSASRTRARRVPYHL